MKINRSNYRKNKHYARVTAAVHAILLEQRVVAPVEVFVRVGYLQPKQLELWRRGQIPFLERVISCNLAKAERILRILKLHAEDRGLKPSWTAYKKWGKGRKTLLRFSKTGNPRIESLYSTNYVAARSRAGSDESSQAEQPPPESPACNPAGS
jgi:hypothetical protein